LIDIAPAASVPAQGALFYVAAVNIIIWAGIFLYIAYLDRKVRNASRHLSSEGKP
jgi:CcmD family protein